MIVWDKDIVRWELYQGGFYICGVSEVGHRQWLSGHHGRWEFCDAPDNPGPIEAARPLECKAGLVDPAVHCGSIP